MGKIHILTKKQKIVLAEVKNNELFQQFYFTGGTALSSIYLNHRVSDDLDIFSEKKFDNPAVLELMEDWGIEHKFTFK